MEREGERDRDGERERGTEMERGGESQNSCKHKQQHNTAQNEVKLAGADQQRGSARRCSRIG